MDILITDVTELHAGNYCVAGWDATEGRMIRPLPGGPHWTRHLLTAQGVYTGNTIRVVITGGQPNSVYPSTANTRLNSAQSE